MKSRERILKEPMTTKADFLLHLSLKLADLPDGELTHDLLKRIRSEFGEIYADAVLALPCEHPEKEIINGHCFQCGRAVINAAIFD